MTLSIMGLFATLRITLASALMLSVNMLSVSIFCYTESHYAECRFAECHMLSAVGTYLQVSIFPSLTCKHWTNLNIWGVNFSDAFLHTVNDDEICLKTLAPGGLHCPLGRYPHHAVEKCSLQSTNYCILSSTMCIQVCAPEFHNDFWQKNYFYFQE